MRGAVFAALGSLGVHAALALAVAWGVAASDARTEDETVRLDLSKMELGAKEKTPERTPSDAVAEQPPDVPASARMPETAEVEPVTASRTETDAAPLPSVAKLEMVAAPDEAPAKLEPAAMLRTIPTPTVATEGSPAESPDEADVDEPVRLTKAIRLVYPSAARQGNRSVSGKVTLRVRVGADGRVVEVTIVESSGSAILDGAAKEAVGKAAFTPARRGGRAVESTVNLPVEFRLR